MISVKRLWVQIPVWVLASYKYQYELQDFSSKVEAGFIPSETERGASLPRLSPWLVDDQLLLISSHSLPSTHISMSRFAFFIRSPLISN